MFVTFMPLHIFFCDGMHPCIFSRIEIHSEFKFELKEFNF
jgi:hypothetical protein